ncbi:non-ribosomal peptide synthetase [Nocardia sienata]|uniref:non-ribosomal peptide synthetase n=1 Tax=Nocardia sienata TaxID=248552 RepID=UPI001FDECB0E|nr:non-ribosomal peptide synthetase [Nocardia sienata]
MSAEKPATLVDLFREQVADTPEATAVIQGTTRLDYRQLDDRSTALARRLRWSGIGPGSMVGVLLDNSVGLVVALLGVLKAGAAYVPMNTGDPRPRIESILHDAHVDIVLATGPDADTLDVPRVFRMGSDGHLDAEDDTAEELAHHDHGPAPRDIAYVIYTSGSTGRPKGVVVEHRALAAYLRRAVAAYPGLAGRALVHSVPSFDLAVTSLFGPLIAGGELEIAALEDPGAPPSFLKITPAHIPLIRTRHPHRAPTADLVVGGDALSATMLDDWRRDHPGVTVVNEYGPTEATVGCGLHRIAPGDHLDPGPVPIGRASTDELHVLDDRLRASDSGELYIAGEQLAHGYLGMAGPTAAAFVANPFGPPGSRMYRSGDRVQCGDDGLLRYRGRVDRQLSISGHRVEPAEVVEVLVRSGAVSDAVVTGREIGGEARLVAYITPGVEGVRDSAALSTYLADRLPWYAVPAAIVVLDDLPLTANGKVDYAALPSPSGQPGHRVSATPDEQRVCELIAELIGIDTVGVNDDFFGLGGTSLAAARLVTAARRLGIEFSLTDVLSKRTVRRLLDASPTPVLR